MNQKKSFKRAIFITLSVFFALTVLVCGYGVFTMFTPNFTTSYTIYVYVYPEKNFDNLCAQLKDSAHCDDIRSFSQIAHLFKYPEKMKTGRYAIHATTTNYDLLKNLRRGQQEPLQVTFNNVRLKQDLSDRLSSQLMIESSEIQTLLDDEAYCESKGFETHTIKAMFLPNTYEVYWNVSAENLLNRFKREYDTFWNDSRRKKAEQIGISPIQVSILASIVEEESAVTDEYSTIAGLYINRLHSGIPLQADPTIKYALGDFAIKRVLNEHLKIDSPYNTYLNSGLPPGPLRVPSITAIEAVLNYKKHNYLYMCAKEDFSGRHNFATTLTEHNQNANRYRTELNRLGIR